jgi:hypothetical protein
LLERYSCHTVVEIQLQGFLTPPLREEIGQPHVPTAKALGMQLLGLTGCDTGWAEM